MPRSTCLLVMDLYANSLNVLTRIELLRFATDSAVWDEE